MSTTITIDWKKLAAQVLDEQQVEQAFFEQAHTFIANRAGPLMADPHQLGFEVVYADDDHTRMVGMMGFKVNREILYAPAFFLNGQIRGTELLYRHSQKKICPLNRDWAAYLIGRHSTARGEGYDQAKTRKNGDGTHLEDIAYPPATFSYKQAAEQAFGEIVAIMEKMSEEIKGNKCPEDPCEEEAPEPGEDEVDGVTVLRRFMGEDGGKEAFDKIAAWFEADSGFAEALAASVAESEWMFEGLEQLHKQASAQPKLVLCTKPEHAKQADAQDTFFQRGYFLWDDRAPGDLQPLTRDMEESIEKAGDPGLYKMLFADGEQRECYVGRVPQEDFSPCDRIDKTIDEEWGLAEDYYNDFERQQPCQRVIVIAVDGGASGEARNPYGECLKRMSDCISDGDLSKSPASGNVYRIFDAGTGSFSQPLRVLSSSTAPSGIVTYKVSTAYGQEFELRHNRDGDITEHRDNFLGEDAYFVPVSTEATGSRPVLGPRDGGKWFSEKRLDPLGDSQSLTGWLLGQGVKRASFICRDGEFSLRAAPRKQTPFMERWKMASTVASQMGVHADAVEALLDDAARDGSCAFFCGGPGFEKFAGPIRVVDSENFVRGSDSTFGVSTETPQGFRLETDSSMTQAPQPHIGDAYDPGMGVRAPSGDSLSDETLLNTPPEQLANLKAQAGVPNVFGHGLVGSLIKTYDSASMLDKYLPDLELGLDRLGRLIFLFYWKPRDFEDAFGTDDMTDLENKLIATFQSYGELILDLLKKNETRGEAGGNVSTYARA